LMPPLALTRIEVCGIHSSLKYSSYIQLKVTKNSSLIT
jgi:hypothetical protein